MEFALGFIIGATLSALFIKIKGSGEAGGVDRPRDGGDDSLG